MSEAVFQVGVKALIMNEENQLLLVSETNNADVYWDIPGGRIDGDESFSQTLERELLEEVLLKPPYESSHFMTVISNKKIPIPNSENHFRLLLVTYVVQLLEDQVPQTNEPGLILSWVSPHEASIKLADKYPSEFCEKIAQLA